MRGPYPSISPKHFSMKPARSATGRISSGAAPSVFIPAGAKAAWKPSFAASRSLASPWAMGRSAPDRLISPKITASRGQRRVLPRRQQRRGHREVGGGFGDPQAAGDVEVDVEPGEADPAARLEHREDHREPARVPAQHRAPRRRQRRGDLGGVDLVGHGGDGAPIPGAMREPMVMPCTGSVAYAVGREKRVEDFFDVRFIYSHAAVADLDLDVFAVGQSFDKKLSAFGHRVAGVEKKIEKDLL